MPRSPDAYPQNLDLVRGRVLAIRLDANAYRAASFLDDRILGQGSRGAWLSGARVAEAARQVADARPLHFIFHTGHVGSTLVSRLLDESGVVLSLREPLPLRLLADAQDVLARPESLLAEPQYDALLDMLLALWSRGYDWTRAVVLKATSSAGRVAGRLLSAQAQSRAIYLNLRAEPYLATLLGGANSVTDLRGHGPERMRRLGARCAAPLAPLHGLSPGELAAHAWLAESMTRRQALERYPDRVRGLDFDDLLADVAAGMEGVALHFGLPRDPRFAAGLARSPVLKQYSKAPELPFPPGEREARLAESRRANCDEIRKGMDWLERLARIEPSVAAVVSGGS